MPESADPSASRIRRLRTASADLFSHGRFAAIAETFAPECVIHINGAGRLVGRDAIGAAIARLRESVADIEIDLKPMLAGPERVAWMRSFRGVQRGAYRGFPASGRTLCWREMAVSTFRGELVVEERIVSDLAEQLLASRRAR